jgi:CHAT domain-containing protein/tetratricopeptide (TPR) repeat protein
MAEDKQKELLNALDQFLKADVVDKQRLLEAQGDLLLTDEAIAILRAQVGSLDEGSEERQYWEAHAALLGACRSAGVSAAFNQLALQSEEETPPLTVGELNELIAWIDAAQNDETVPRGSLVREIRRALTFVNPRTAPDIWAGLQSILGYELLGLSEHSDEALLNEAVAACRAALTVFTRDRVPLAWASTQFNFGSALRKLGDERDDDATLRDAVAAFRLALEEFTREQAPLEWEMTQHRLGLALWALGERGDYAALTEAIAAFRNILQVLTRERAPREWAETQNSLGHVHVLLGKRGDVAALGQAITAYRQALEVLTRDRHPHRWAKMQANLGDALSHLGKHRHYRTCLFFAVEAFRRALEVSSPKSDPRGWATIQMSLADALREIGEREKNAEYFEQAAGAVREAQDRIDRKREPLKWACVQHNRANILAAIGENSDPSALLEAVAVYRLALEEITRERVPLNWAMTQYCLGTTLHLLGERGDDAALRDAVDAYRLALGERTRERAPRQWMKTYRALAHAFLLSGDCRAVVAHLAPELDGLVEAALGARTEADRRQVIGAMSGLGDVLAFAHLKIDAPHAAMRAAIQGRGVMLEVAHLIRQLDRDETLSAARKSFIDAARAYDLISTRRTEAVINGKPGPSEHDVGTKRAANEAAYATFRAEIARARAENPGSGTAPLTAEELRRLVPEGGALAIPIVTEIGGAVILLAHGDAGTADSSDIAPIGLRVLWLDGMTSNRANELAQDSFEARQRFEALIDENTPTKSDDGAVTAKKRASLRTAVATFDQSIRETAERLGDLLMRPLAEALQAMGLAPASRGDPDAPEVVMLAPGRLASLPLAAAPCGFGWFMEGYALSFAPSASALAASAEVRRRKPSDPPHVLCITNPTNDLADPKKPDELMRNNPAAEVYKADGTVIDLHLEATRETVLEELGNGATHLVVYTHGGFDPLAPEQSFLQLVKRDATSKEADDAAAPQDTHDKLFPADLRDVPGLQLRTVILGACNSGRFGVHAAPDEFEGLIGGFMEAGAASVCGSHWPVSAAATAPFVCDVLKHEKEGHSMARAVRAASLAMRAGVFGTAFMNAPVYARTPAGLMAPSRGANHAPNNDPLPNPPPVLTSDAPFYAAAFAAWGAGQTTKP